MQLLWVVVTLCALYFAQAFSNVWQSYILSPLYGNGKWRFLCILDCVYIWLRSGAALRSVERLISVNGSLNWTTCSATVCCFQAIHQKARKKLKEKHFGPASYNCSTTSGGISRASASLLACRTICSTIFIPVNWCMSDQCSSFRCFRFFSLFLLFAGPLAGPTFRTFFTTDVWQMMMEGFDICNVFW